MQILKSVKNKVTLIKKAGFTILIKKITKKNIREHAELENEQSELLNKEVPGYLHGNFQHKDKEAL